MLLVNVTNNEEFKHVGLHSQNWAVLFATTLVITQ